MDFLDPKAKKIRNIRLMVGYVLVAFLVITSSMILVFQAYGFDVDRKTGQVIQNGLVYIDSAPDNAELYLNGMLHKDRTNARMTLPQGTYEILIKKDGYRDWHRTVDVKGGSVERITYPLLVLQELNETEIDNFGKSRPKVATQSPDRRWLMVSKENSALNFKEYDLNSVDNNQTVPVERDVIFNPGLLKPPDGAESMEVVEWSTDNENFLVKHNYGTGHEFVVFNRDDPALSVNINQLLGLNPDRVTLRDKKPDQWYLFTSDGGLLQAANKDREINTVASNVLSYKTHDSTVVLYAVKSTDKILTIYIKQNDQTYSLRTVSAGAVRLDIARYDDAWYVAVGSNGDKRTYVYKNPVTTLAGREGLKPAPITVLKASQPINDVAFSTNTRFIMAQNGQSIGVYDAEKSETYNFKLAVSIDKGTKASWMDGHRIQYRSGGLETIVDFDGSNNQKLLSAASGQATFFDRDYKILYTINNSQPTTFGLMSTPLRAEADR